jgi:deoxyribodipyrimidine photolyase-related protein
MAGSNGKSSKKKPNGGKIGVWVQPDQLSLSGRLLTGASPQTHTLVLVESLPTHSKLAYHKKRLVLVLSLQRHFAEEARDQGFEVYYYALGDPKQEKLTSAGETACLRDFIKRSKVGSLRVMEATEYDENELLGTLEKDLKIPVEIVPNDQFMIDRRQFRDWFDSLEDPSVENFYRQRRRETDLLMEDGQPLGGRWNFDADNRVPPTGNMPVPPLPSIEPDETTREVMGLVDKLFPHSPGESSDFDLPVTRSQVGAWFEDFLSNRLRLFGMYQDAMILKSPAMYHAFLSPYLNHDLIRPQEILDKVADAYQTGDVPINSAEGFIRQILGWREYVHGTYWMKMPEYREENYFGCERDLPSLMNDGETHLKCVKCVIDQSRVEAYAHHIQRLMIVGNFALLVGVEPKALVRWFREMFIDSAEWATLPNVMGVALYADGGSFGAKPYAASAHYINKMSDYCHGCHYRGKKRLGEKACPLNYLYWNFVSEHQERLRTNPRMQNAIQMYRLKPEAERKLIATSSYKFISKIEANGTDLPAKAKKVR